MKEGFARNGHKILQVSRAEIFKIGGFGICDRCNGGVIDGTIVGVLNYTLCPECFARWDARTATQFYEEDVPYENEILGRYKKILGGIEK